MNKCCDIGSYECGVILAVPDNIDIRKVCSNEKKKSICVDKCLAPAIKALWNAGIPTINSCCGHGAYEANIFIDPRYISEMRSENKKIESFRCDKGKRAIT